jgi:lipoyl(octanoyl) transferase
MLVVIASLSDIRLIMPKSVEDFDAVLLWQESVQNDLLNGSGPECLWLGEHHPVVTLGRGADEAHLLTPESLLEAAGTSVRRIDRGGDVTWHGPGQLVGYPILNLNRHRPDLHWYLRQLEKVLMTTLSVFGVASRVIKGKTGVWVDDDGKKAKIASIGVHCSRWITKHGFSLNVNPDLSALDDINACGLGLPQSSLSRLLGTQTPGMNEVRLTVAEKFEMVFRSSCL